MRGFILAAGLGTRLRPFTDTTPKPLVEIGGEPLIERAIAQLVAAGVTEIGINVFHLGEQIIERLGTGRNLGAHLTFFDERPEVLGTGGGLKNAESFLRGDGNGQFLLANADVWHSFDLRQVIAAHQPHHLATLAVHRTPRRPELHTVSCAIEGPGSGRHAGHIVQLAGKPHSVLPGDFMAIYTGVAVYSTRLLDWLPAGKVSGLVSHGLIPAMERGERVAWVEPEGAWFDCGTHAEVLRASAHALKLRGVLAREALGFEAFVLA